MDEVIYLSIVVEFNETGSEASARWAPVSTEIDSNQFLATEHFCGRLKTIL
jgi:hypothetical protein